MSTPSVTVVIVTYNSQAVISQALDSVKDSFDAGVVDACIVVDNQSADDTVRRVRAEHPWCTLVETGENLGFGRGCNVGLARARTPYVLLLNPDATLPQPGLLRLIAFLDATPQAGAVAPAIRQPDGRLQWAGGLLRPRDLLLGALGSRRAYADHRVVQPGGAPFRTSWICGAVVLARMAMLDEIGHFDPRYFLYFEETDLWWRAQEAGWEIWAVGEAMATHVQAASARSVGRRMFEGCIAEHYFRSRFRYLTRHFGWPTAAVAEAGELGLMAARAAVRALRGRDFEEFWVRLSAPFFGHALRDRSS